MQRLSKGISDQFFALRKFFPHASHWDGHQHLHLHPVVFAIAARAAAQAGFQRVRLLLKPETCHLDSLALALISRSALPHARTADQRWPDQVYGLRDTGRMTRQRLKTLQETTTRPDARLIEIYYHPGADAMVE